MSDRHNRIQVQHLFEETLALTTLGNVTALNDLTRVDSGRLQGSKILKMKAWCHIRSKTSGEGPIVCGFSIGLTATEIASALISDPQSNEDQTNIAANRKVFPIWVFGRLVTDSPGPSHGDPNLFRDVRFPTWRVIEGEDLHFFAFNAGGGSLTTGCVVDWGYTIVSRWERD